MKGKINKSTTIVRDFKNSSSKMDRSSRQNISKGIVELNNTMNRLCIIDIYRLLHPKNNRIHTFL